MKVIFPRYHIVQNLEHKISIDCKLSKMISRYNFPWLVNTSSFSALIMKSCPKEDLRLNQNIFSHNFFQSGVIIIIIPFLKNQWPPNKLTYTFETIPNRRTRKMLHLEKLFYFPIPIALTQTHRDGSQINFSVTETGFRLFSYQACRMHLRLITSFFGKMINCFRS